MKRFIYTKPDGSVSNRSLFVLNEPSDSYFGIDLSEFSTQEQEQYNKMLGELKDSFEKEIENLGLKHSYRRFKEERIS